MPTFGSLFAGIGGLDLGLERAGWACKWQVENDEYATRVLERHWPDVKRYKDIREVNELERVDLICGGFPCQDISYAGKGEGIDGARSGLWSEFRRIICLVRPEYVLVENVPALLTRGLGRVLGELAESGYDAEWDCIPAATVGAPHKRDRVFIIAYTDGIGRGNAYGRRAAVSVFSGPLPSVVWPWTSKPPLLRGNDGIPRRVDRLRCLGNAVVPQVAEYIGRQIIQATKEV